MSLKEKIVEIVQTFDMDLRIRRAVVGLAYCAVQLETGSTGVAYCFPREGCGLEIAGDGPVAGRKVHGIVPLLGGANAAASSLAMATINALIAGRFSVHSYTAQDVLDALDIRRGDTVCLVGAVLPVKEKLRRDGIDVVAVDVEPRPGAEPAERSAEILPRSQVAIITATSIINGTVDGLLELAGECREVAVLGPSTPMLPEAFAGTPVRCLCGIQIDDAAGVLHTVSEGMGFRVFRRDVTKITMAVD